MNKRLTSLFLLLALAGGVLAGTPLPSGNMNNKMMPCCKKAKSLEQSKEASIARLCCSINCSDTAPTSPGSSSNFSPTGFIVSDSIIKQIASLLLIKQKTDSTVVFSQERNILPRKFTPKYLQHHSFLI